MTFTIQAKWLVLVVEDDPMRIEWFKSRIPSALFVDSAEGAIMLLQDQPGIDAVFLDHDLNFADAAFPNLRPGSGVRVARHLAQLKFQGFVVIHSVNEAGARAMLSHLPAAHAAPFGTFEISRTDAASQ